MSRRSAKTSEEGSGPASASASASASGRSGGRRAKRGADVVAAASDYSIAGHPHARQSVRQVKSLVGLAGFALALLLSLRAGVPLTIASERALVAGVCGYLVAWGCAVAVWRAVLTATLRARVDAIQTARKQAAKPATK